MTMYHVIYHRVIHAYNIDTYTTQVLNVESFMNYYIINI